MIRLNKFKKEILLNFPLSEIYKSFICNWTNNCNFIE